MPNLDEIGYGKLWCALLCTFTHDINCIKQNVLFLKFQSKIDRAQAVSAKDLSRINKERAAMKGETSKKDSMLGSDDDGEHVITFAGHSRNIC